MKKITLLFVSLLTLSASAQELISFEAREGYTVNSSINGQNNWSTEPLNPPPGPPPIPLRNQEVSSDRATDGTNSLKLGQDDNFSPQGEPRVGARYFFANALDVSSLVVSLDFFVSDVSDPNDRVSDYRITLENPTNSRPISTIFIRENGEVEVRNRPTADSNSSDIVDTSVATALPNTWHNYRFEISGQNLEVFFDDVSVLNAFVSTPNLDVESISFLHDNWESTGYLDNLRISSEALSSEELLVQDFNFRYMSSTKELLLDAQTPLTNIRLYNMMGQQVYASNLNSNREQVNVQDLSTGIYIAQVTMNGKTESFKFSKH